MEIWVEFNDGKWRVSPDPAEVKRGTKVLWRFRADNLVVNRVNWVVYFDQEVPLAVEGVRGPGRGAAARISGPAVLAVETTRQEDRQHSGATIDTVATVPGDYKYGVRAQDADNGEPIGDEDPRLIIR